MVDSVVRQQNTVVLQPGVRIGTLQVPSSKSQLHRLLICAALGERPVAISYRGLSEDIAATVRCLKALGAKITVSEDGPQSVLHVSPLDRSSSPSGVELDCGESGSTLRFLLPVAGLLGADCTFVMQGRLSKRPLAEYGEQLTAHGMTMKQEGDRLKVSGRLTAGDYVLPGNISSQFISGLLMAFGALQGQSRLQVVSTPESKPYIDMTEAVLRQSGIVFEKDGLQWTVNGGQKYALPESLQAEGDYSSATFFLCMGAFSEEGILVKGLDPASAQGDKKVLDVLERFGAKVSRTEEGILVQKGVLKGTEIDASQIPDAVPALSVVAALSEGKTRIVNAARLRLKESDRIRSTSAMLRALGAETQEFPDGMRIRGQRMLKGGTVDPFGDHRIAMAATVAACRCEQAVTVDQPDCVSKSYPAFWEDLGSLQRV